MLPVGISLWLVPLRFSAPVDEHRPGSASLRSEPARSARLVGSASVDRRHPVVGATVVVRPESDATRAYLTATDEKGRFRLDDIPDGSYAVEIRRQGLKPVVKRDVGLKLPFRAVVEVEMQPDPAAPGGPGPAAPAAAPRAGSGAIRGRVVDPEGRPLSEVVLRIVPADARDDPRFAWSDAEGRFELSGLVPGPWRLSALGLAYLPVRAVLGLGRELELQIVLVPQPAGYEPLPIDLLPQEQPVPPEALGVEPLEDAPSPEAPHGGGAGSAARTARNPLRARSLRPGTVVSRRIRIHRPSQTSFDVEYVT